MAALFNAFPHSPGLEVEGKGALYKYYLFYSANIHLPHRVLKRGFIHTNETITTLFTNSEMFIESSLFILIAMRKISSLLFGGLENYKIFLILPFLFLLIASMYIFSMTDRVSHLPKIIMGHFKSNQKIITGHFKAHLKNKSAIIYPGWSFFTRLKIQIPFLCIQSSSQSGLIISF